MVLTRSQCYFTLHFVQDVTLKSPPVCHLSSSPPPPSPPWGRGADWRTQSAGPSLPPLLQSSAPSPPPPPVRRPSHLQSSGQSHLGEEVPLRHRTVAEHVSADGPAQLGEVDVAGDVGVAGVQQRVHTPVTPERPQRVAQLARVAVVRDQRCSTERCHALCQLGGQDGSPRGNLELVPAGDGLLLRGGGRSDSDGLLAYKHRSRSQGHAEMELTYQVKLSKNEYS